MRKGWRAPSALWPQATDPRPQGVNKRPPGAAAVRARDQNPKGGDRRAQGAACGPGRRQPRPPKRSTREFLKQVPAQPAQPSPESELIDVRRNRRGKRKQNRICGPSQPKQPEHVNDYSHFTPYRHSACPNQNMGAKILCARAWRAGRHGSARCLGQRARPVAGPPGRCPYPCG